MNERTLCFLVDAMPPTKLLLGFKKRGFGAGKFVGIGGKIEKGEEVETAVIREVFEEIHVTLLPQTLQPFGILNFQFPTKPAWSQQVHLFVTQTWTGTITQSDEIEPVWFTIDQIPYDKMWQDAYHWLPYILAGQPIKGSFIFADDNETVEHVNIIMKDKL